MTSASPPHATPLHPSPTTPRRLRLVHEDQQEEGEDRTAPDDGSPLVGYLVLLPKGVDPAALFADAGLRPQIHPVAADTVPLPTRTPDQPVPAGGPIRIDTERHVAELDGEELDLTYLEFALLARLVAHPHRVHTREQLVEHVWGHTHVGDGRTVDVHIARLRRKLGTAHRQRIATVRRVGYKYVPAP
ncbi:winged helix-turn-helix domain-containing protein [Streptomyces sp. NPDC094038]|uniref:winged helix-turn-helix domain-containing protein n=1 Tax=Streptomyces sp. NPDC094038 TaxID=3366055 RepID=UPI00381AD059